MAVGNILSLAQFIEAIPVKRMSLFPPERNEYAETADGQIIGAVMGPALWTGSVTMPLLRSRDARAVRALLGLASRADMSFICRDLAYPGPESDPGGYRFNPMPSPLVTVATNMRDASLTGFPANYALDTGDYISWPYGSNPVRYAFHQILFPVMTGPGGSASVELTPRVARGGNVSVRPVIYRPFFRAKITSVDIGEDEGIIADGSSFTFIEVKGQ